MQLFTLIAQSVQQIPPIDIKEGTLDPRQVVLNIINYSLFFIGAIALIYVIYAGILFITSGGEADRTAKARNTLIYAILGIIVVVLSYAIVNWAANVLAPNIP